MEYDGFDEYPEIYEIDWTLGPPGFTTVPHKNSSRHHVTATTTDQAFSSPYAYNGTEGRTPGTPCGEASQSQLELPLVLPPALSLTDAKAVTPSSGLEPGGKDEVSLESKRRPRISPAKWEQIRPIFAALYRDQYKTLADTRRILEEEYGFKAS